MSDKKIALLLLLHLKDLALNEYNDTEDSLKGQTLEQIGATLGNLFSGMENYGQELFIADRMKPGQTVSEFYTHIREAADRAGVFDSGTYTREQSESLVWMKFN